MVATKKIGIVLFLSLLFAALTASLFSVRARSFAFAEELDPSTVELSPVEYEDTDIVYHCFNSPRAVFADGVGILVAGDRSIEAVSGESQITAQKQIGAQKAFRHIEHGEHDEYLLVLNNGHITLHYGDNTPSTLQANGAIVDFDVSGDRLYAVTRTSLITATLGAQDFDGAQTVETPLTSDRYSSVYITALAVKDDKIYVAVNSPFGRKQDLCVITEGGRLTSVLLQSSELLGLTAEDGQSGLIYALTRDKIIGYTTLDGGGLVEQVSADGAQIAAIYAYGGYLYTIDTLNALHKLSADLTEDKVLLASGSDAQGFFNTPADVAAKNSKLYIADCANGRIAVYSDGVEYPERRFFNPISVACDSENTVYVAYEYNKIGVFANGDLSEENEMTLTEPQLGSIKQIALGADKTLYVLADNGLWKLSNNTLIPIDSTRYKAITVGIGRNNLYALTDNSIVRFTDGGENSTEFCRHARPDAFALAVDLDETVFLLARAEIIRIRAGVTVEFTLSDGDGAYTLGGASGNLVLCTVENGFATYGDLLIADTYKHRLLKADARAALGARLVDENYRVPDLAGDNSPSVHNRLIRKTLRDAAVFSLPMETKPIYTIAQGRNVIVPSYILEETYEYSLILIDDTQTGKLIQGYVYRDALSEPLPYAPPPSPTATVFNAATPVYKYPSRSAPVIYGYGAVDKNTSFAMLDFVESYRDDYGYLWHRIDIVAGDGTHYEGYILAINISTQSFEPVYIRPAYNAEIISYENSAFAPAYFIEDGAYVKIAELPTGTRVEVLGAFDASQRYTQIKYLDPERGTLTCYVETVYIDYNGVNIVLIVAVIVIVITVILAGIIIAKSMRAKKKRLVGDEDERSINE